MAKRLSDAVTRRIVAHCVACLRNAGVDKPEFAASRPAEGFERAYDTLVLGLEPTESRLAQDPSPAELIREALLLLHALSNCPGYVFHKNFAFWNTVIMPGNRNYMPMGVKTNLQFPRVVLDWNPHYHLMIPRTIDLAASLLEFERSVLEVFAPSSSRWLSSDGERMLVAIHKCCASAARDGFRPIECVVAIRFGELASETDALVDKLVSSATTLTSTTPMAIHSAFTWTGVLMSPCQSEVFSRHNFISLENLRVLRWLCLALPTTTAFDFALSHSRLHQMLTQSLEPLSAPFVALISAAIGLVGTELLGRLTVLDLRSAEINFASLCTMLPLARSLERLVVVVQSKLDLLWLVYAATHPLTPTTKWRALQVDYVGGPTVEWTQLGRALASQSVLEALWSSSVRTTTAVGATARVVQQDLGGHYVRRTAKVARDVQFLSADGSETFVQVVDGCDVELCDTTTSLDELVRESGKPDLDEVAVVVAGEGLGWVHKQHLMDLTDTRYEGAPQSSLTTLVLDPESTQASDMDAILALFGQTLVHLSAALTDPFPVATVARACPQLETLEIAVWRWGTPNSTPSMAKLRSVSVECDDESLEALFQWLQSLPRLETVRFRFGEYSEEEPWDELDGHLSALAVAKARTLRSLTLIRRSGATDAPLVGGDDHLPCAISSKCALLSVLRRARYQQRDARDAAVAQLDSDMIRHVFSYAGPSLTRRVAEGDALWPTGWFDRHW